jgi:hypothetical protein
MTKLQVIMVLEILGKPKDHVREALSTLVTKLGSEKGVKIINKTIHEPVEAKNSKDLFTSFIELEASFESIQDLFRIMFSYMPSHMEIISPDKISFSNVEFSEFGNVLLQRLHNYDAITKKVLVDKDILLKKLYGIAPHLFKKSSKTQQSKDSTEKKEPSKKTIEKSK